MKISKKKNVPYNKLKGLRAEKGMTAEKISSLLGISVATYYRKENRTDGSDFYLDEAKRLAGILGVEPREIFFIQ